MTKLRVLSIDGGGIRGVIPATILAEIERVSGRTIADLFDLVVGTSTGGILALAMTCPRGGQGPRSAAEVGALYEQRGGRIFPLGGHPIVEPGRLVPSLDGTAGSVMAKLRRLAGWDGIAKTLSPFGGGRGGHGNARYPAGPLEEELREQLGATMLSAAVKPVCVVSCDLERGVPLVLRGGGLDQSPIGDVSMCEAARATSAGPTFFPLHPLRDESGTVRMCADGGLVANDPAFVGFSEATAMARTTGTGTEGVVLVSIGTGQARARPPEIDDVPQLTPNRTWLSLPKPIAKTLTAAGGELQREQLRQILGPDYLRLQPTLGFGAVHAMDNATPRNIAALRKTADQFVRDEAAAIGRVVESLKG